MHRYLLCIQTIPIVLFHLAEHFSSKHPPVPMYSDKWFSNVVCLLVCFVIQSNSCFSHHFQLGPQLFDNSENRGVRRAYLPAPRKEQFELGSTYSDIIKWGRLLFFLDAALKPNKCFWLTDSSGQPLPHFGPNTDLRTYLRTATLDFNWISAFVPPYPP